ncbi:hypothetical protein [Achromobacter insolitus]|uniref:Uncharacterized protein n=1 Tax=Achromobacter insolitus TaxID=217204 RepID=A0A6S7F7Z6_9BURK|nr:hypothetical protein [Achromobacter insolitus]CAB3931576.1 hypothetical protein LMG6000_02223 [Achromobacter insolitus]CAB3939447.1 hypothetical protein LMG5997_04040 [Achromobacter insolitus]
MTTTNDGGPAFPVESGRGAANGMTLRDYFAAKALHGLITMRHPHHHGEAGPAQLAEDAYLIADAMLFMRGAE